MLYYKGLVEKNKGGKKSKEQTKKYSLRGCTVYVFYKPSSMKDRDEYQDNTNLEAI